MKRSALVTILFTLILGIPVFAQNSSILLDFSSDTAETNQVTLMGAGFGQYPMPEVAFGNIPTDRAFDGATDGKGMIIQADPGEGVMILTQPIQTASCALIRCSARSSAPHASIYLASIDQGENTFVSTITANNGNFFLNRYSRIADFFLPPSTGFQGIVQVTNTSSTEKLTVYLDNLEIIPIDPNLYYSGEFVDGDESDPSIIKIDPHTDATSQVVDSPKNRSTDNHFRFDFSSLTLQELGVTVMGASFGTMPQAQTEIAEVSTENSFMDATDGKGVVIHAKPGEGTMLLFPLQKTSQSALLRCSIRTDSPSASVYLASIDQGENAFISTITPNNGSFFFNRWKRLSDYFLPPSSAGFQPLIQVVNTSKDRSITVYIDNLDIYYVDPDEYYSGAFLDGNENDPELIVYNPVQATPTSVPNDNTPTPLPPTPTPSMNDQQTYKVWVADKYDMSFNVAGYLINPVQGIRVNIFPLNESASISESQTAISDENGFCSFRLNKNQQYFLYSEGACYENFTTDESKEAERVIGVYPHSFQSELVSQILPDNFMIPAVEKIHTLPFSEVGSYLVNTQGVSDFVLLASDTVNIKDRTIDIFSTPFASLLVGIDSFSTLPTKKHTIHDSQPQFDPITVIIVTASSALAAGTLYALFTHSGSHVVDSFSNVIEQNGEMYEYALSINPPYITGYVGDEIKIEAWVYQRVENTSNWSQFKAIPAQQFHSHLSWGNKIFDLTRDADPESIPIFLHPLKIGKAEQGLGVTYKINDVELHSHAFVRVFEKGQVPNLLINNLAVNPNATPLKINNLYNFSFDVLNNGEFPITSPFNINIYDLPSSRSSKKTLVKSLKLPSLPEKTTAHLDFSYSFSEPGNHQLVVFADEPTSNQATGDILEKDESDNWATITCNVVNPQNQPPSIISTPIVITQMGSLYSYPVKAVDSDQDTLTYKLEKAPNGMSINTQSGLIQWKPMSTFDFSEKNVRVIVAVSDGKNTTRQEYSIYVKDTLPTISFDPIIPAQNGIIPISFTITDVDGNSNNFAVYVRSKDSDKFIEKFSYTGSGHYTIHWNSYPDFKNSFEEGITIFIIQENSVSTNRFTSPSFTIDNRVVTPVPTPTFTPTPTSIPVSSQIWDVTITQIACSPVKPGDLSVTLTVSIAYQAIEAGQVEISSGENRVVIPVSAGSDSFTQTLTCSIVDGFNMIPVNSRIQLQDETGRWWDQDHTSKTVLVSTKPAEKWDVEIAEINPSQLQPGNQSVTATLFYQALKNGQIEVGLAGKTIIQTISAGVGSFDVTLDGTITDDLDSVILSSRIQLQDSSGRWWDQDHAYKTIPVSTVLNGIWDVEILNIDPSEVKPGEQTVTVTVSYQALASSEIMIGIGEQKVRQSVSPGTGSLSLPIPYNFSGESSSLQLSAIIQEQDLNGRWWHKDHAYQTIAVLLEATPTSTPTRTSTPSHTPTSTRTYTPTLTFTFTKTPFMTLTPTLTVSQTPTSTMTQILNSSPTGFVHSKGRFLLEGDVWIEYHDDVDYIFTFTEAGRNDDWLYLFDSSRNMLLSIPLKGGVMYWKTTGDWNPIYEVTPIWISKTPINTPTFTQIPTLTQTPVPIILPNPFNFTATPSFDLEGNGISYLLEWEYNNPCDYFELTLYYGGEGNPNASIHTEIVEGAKRSFILHIPYRNYVDAKIRAVSGNNFSDYVKSVQQDVVETTPTPTLNSIPLPYSITAQTQTEGINFQWGISQSPEKYEIHIYEGSQYVTKIEINGDNRSYLYTPITSGNYRIAIRSFQNGVYSEFVWSDAGNWIAPTSTATPSLTNTPSPTKRMTPTLTPTQTPTLIYTPKPTATYTPTPTATLTYTPSPTYTSTPIPLDDVNINTPENFPDPNFRRVAEEAVGVGPNEPFTERQASFVGVINCQEKGIKSMHGLEYFKNLIDLICNGNQLTSLDVTHNPMLTQIICYNNQLISLDVQQNPGLQSLDCCDNKLTYLDVTQNLGLQYLRCFNNQLTSLDVTHNPVLQFLGCSNNPLTRLEVTFNIELRYLGCGENQLTNLDVTKNPGLQILGCAQNQLTSLDVTQNPELQILGCENNQLIRLDVTMNTALTSLWCSSNQLTSLDVTRNTALTQLSCWSNQLTSLDVTHNPALIGINCHGNNIANLDFTQNPVLIDASYDEYIMQGDTKIPVTVIGWPKN